MCLLSLLAISVFMLINVFVKSAMLLLPWTLAASGLAGCSGMLAGRYCLRKAPEAAQLAAFLVSVGLTYAFGYLGWMLVPPVAPEQPTNAWQLLLELPEPEQQDLWQMFPVHLGIASVVAGLIATSIIRAVMARDPEIQFLDEPLGKG